MSAVKKLPKPTTLDGTFERAASLARRGVPTRDAMYGHQGAYAAPRPQFVERSASQKVRRRRRRRRRRQSQTERVDGFPTTDERDVRVRLCATKHSVVIRRMRVRRITMNGK